jgi:hypothetical protein
MIRMTIRLADTLMREVSRVAAESGLTITTAIENAICDLLSRRVTPEKRRAVRLPGDGRGGAQPGVDLDDSAAPLDLMEAR